jgi:hypothetical protein
MPSRQFVKIAPKVVAKAENNFVHTPGILPGTADMTMLLTSVLGLLLWIQMQRLKKF